MHIVYTFVHCIDNISQRLKNAIFIGIKIVVLYIKRVRLITNKLYILLVFLYKYNLYLYFLFVIKSFIIFAIKKIIQCLQTKKNI